MTSTTGWTVHDAVEQLDPPMDEAHVRALLVAFDVPVVGQRAAGRGRPQPEYDQAAIMRGHAAATAVKAGLLLGVICPPSPRGA